MEDVVVAQQSVPGSDDVNYPPLAPTRRPDTQLRGDVAVQGQRSGYGEPETMGSNVIEVEELDRDLRARRDRLDPHLRDRAAQCLGQGGVVDRRRWQAARHHDSMPRDGSPRRQLAAPTRSR